MNSSMLRTKLLNEKSSNIYIITKHFHSGSVSVPRGRSLRRQSTGQAPYQVLHCTGTSPLQCTTTPWVKGRPHNVWQGRIKGPESSQSWSPILLGMLLLLHLPHLAQQAHCAALGAHCAGHMLRCTKLPCMQAGGICTSSFLIPPFDFVSLPSGPTWYHLDIIPLLVWLCTSNARRNLVCANLLCTSPPFPAPQCEPIAAPSP